MILSEYKTKRTTIAICKCDYCGKEIIRSKSRLAKQQFCNHFCTTQARLNHTYKYDLKAYRTSAYDDSCIICGKPYDDSFVDKGNHGRADNGGYRYLCSKQCLNIYYDNKFEEEKLAMKRMYQYQLKRELKLA